MGGGADPVPSVAQVAAPPPPPQLANSAVVKTAKDITAGGLAASGKGYAGTLLTSSQGAYMDNSTQPLHPKLLGGS